MKVSADEMKHVELNIYQNRAEELAVAIVSILQERGQVSFPAIRDAIVEVAVERFKRYDRT